MAKINSEVKALFVNDIQVPLVDGTFKFVMGGKERTSQMGSDRRLGASEANQAGSCDFEIVYTEKFDLLGVLDVTDAKIRVVWNKGAEWLMTGADLQTSLEGSAPEGKISVRYEGNKWLIPKK